MIKKMEKEIKVIRTNGIRKLKDGAIKRVVKGEIREYVVRKQPDPKPSNTKAKKGVEKVKLQKQVDRAYEKGLDEAHKAISAGLHECWIKIYEMGDECNWFQFVNFRLSGDRKVRRQFRKAGMYLPDYYLPVIREIRKKILERL